MDDGLREELAAALLGWSGGDGQRKSRDTVVDDGRETPKAEPTLAQRGYIRGLMQYADEDGASVDDDIDADSSVSMSDSRSEASRPRSQPAPVSGPQKELPPLPTVSVASPPPQMSCRISSFPFTHPVDMPELMPDQDDTFIATPSMPDPDTPGIASDVFRPLTQISSHPDLQLGPFSPVLSEPQLHDRMRRMSITSALPDGDGLGIIREEDDLNEDGVSMLTPTEASFGSRDESYADLADKMSFLTVENPPHARSVSSLGSSGSSTEWRPSNANASRKSVSLLSRMRNSNRPPEDEFIEKRSLTPLQLSTPPRAAYNDELLTPVGPPPSVSSSTNQSRSDTTSRFFHRMPWVSDSQPKKAEAVFGTDLKESIRVAPMKSRISHKGKSTSYRTFPLCVYKCCEYIRRAGGTDGYIFTAPGDPCNVASLKTIFSQPPTYGEDFYFEGSAYTVHDAARLILLFLEELPKPLISPSVVKSWILLARQEGAIEPPCARVDTGLDFWTEALNRLSTANRNLTKHLLTLFAEILLAASGRITDADARHFAASVSRAMFHQDADGATVGGKETAKKSGGKRNVQPTLALAFLIRKRGEYAASLGGNGGGSEGSSKRDSRLFLPSTKEIMEWKGMHF